MKLPGGYRIATPAAVVLLVAFFLPWITVSCAGQPVGQFSGLDLTMGVEGAGGAMPDLFLIPLAGLLAIVLAFLAAKNGVIKPALDVFALGALAILPVIVLLLRFYGAQQEAAASGFGLHFRLGFYGVVLGLLGLAAGGIWNWWEHKHASATPDPWFGISASSPPPLPQPLPPPPTDPEAAKLGPTEVPPTVLPAQSIPRAELIILKGEFEGRRFPLLGDNILIGRSVRCDIQIPDRSVSREHVRIRYYEGQWFIQDQQSAAGVVVNGRKILAGPLQNGDVIQLGETHLRFSAG